MFPTQVDFQDPQHEVLRVFSIWTVCMYVCMCPVPQIEACDWSTRFMRVISLGLSSVNRFCSTDWEVCEGCVQKCTRLL